MWYVLWTTSGKEEKTKQTIINHVDPSLYSRCVVPYRNKRHFYRGQSEIVTILLFPSYVFIETDNVKEFAEVVGGFPGYNIILQTDDLFCPIYKEEEYLFTDLINEYGIIDISKGYMDGDRVHVTEGPLVGYEEHIKKVIRRKSLAILSMNIYNRLVEYGLGLDITD